jgi:hypothetical protein
MGAKIQSTRRGWEVVPASPAGPIEAVAAEPEADAELEAETETVASFFEALPVEWKAYFDDEARCGREAYPWP